MSITPNTRIALPVTVGVACVVALVATGFRAANILNDINGQLKEIRLEVKAIATDRWTWQDQERWAARLYKQNKGIQLEVPDVLEIKKSP